MVRKHPRRVRRRPLSSGFLSFQGVEGLGMDKNEHVARAGVKPERHDSVIGD